jgi:two-component system LytT family response regulator
MSIRMLIVDDEPLSRLLIRRLLTGDPDFKVIGECQNGLEALAFLAADRPDVVLLDVQMPELGGFEVLSRIDPARMPVVVFLTAYDTFALKAFEAHALDYLLKPLDEDRFYAALRRVKTYLSGARNEAGRHRMIGFAQELPAPDKVISRLMVKSGGSVVFLKIEEIDWFEATGNYVALHVGKKNYLLRGRLSEFENKLPPERFFRIHRSTIVNLDQVKELVPLFKGEGIVVLKDGARLSASRSRCQRLREYLSTDL